jgi:hypothetical protein
MATLLFVRITGALGVTSLALFFIGLIPFLGAVPSAGAGPETPGFTVNREFKGDRLPLVSDINAAISRGELRSARHSQAREEMPIGCEPAFSPVSSPRLAYYYGRCAT